MFTSNKFYSLFLIFPVVFVLALVPNKSAAADVASEQQQEASEASEGIVSAVIEGLLALGAVYAVVFFCGARRTSKGKTSRKFDKLSSECCAPPRAPTCGERTRKEMPAEGSHSKKARSEISADSLRMAAERTRLTELVHKLAKNADISEAAKAIHLLEETCGTAGLSEYSSLITMCSKANDVDGAHMWLKRLQEKGHAPNAVCFNAVINSYAKQGDINKAAAVAGAMREAGVDHDTVTYNSLIDGCARQGDAVNAQAWMKKMLAAGVKASVISFGSVMRACATAGLNNDLEYWIEQADALGIQLNTICFSAVIHMFAKNDDVKSADYWLTRMMRCNISPSVHCFTGMVDAACKDGDLQRADEILCRMREMSVEPDAGIYSWLIIAACKSEKFDCAQNWINEAAEKGLVLSRQARAAMFAARLVKPVETVSVKHSSGKPLSNKESNETLAKYEVDHTEAQTYVGKRFVGTVKEYISTKFGYIVCDETYLCFKRDIFLRNVDNPEQFAKGQKVSFVLQLDRRRGLPYACDLQIFHK